MNLLHPEKEVVITAAKRTLAIVFVCFINPTPILLSLPALYYSKPDCSKNPLPGWYN